MVIAALAAKTLERVGPEISDVQIAKEVLNAGELVTWEPRKGEVCMPWVSGSRLATL